MVYAVAVSRAVIIWAWDMILAVFWLPIQLLAALLRRFSGISYHVEARQPFLRGFVSMEMAMAIIYYFKNSNAIFELSKIALYVCAVARKTIRWIRK